MTSESVFRKYELPVSRSKKSLLRDIGHPRHLAKASLHLDPDTLAPYLLDKIRGREKIKRDYI